MQGLYFYNSRWYDPAVGRFLQADSIVPGAGNPQAFNRYSYVLNSPLNHIDPTGHFTEDELDQFFSGWQDWSALLIKLMKDATWGSVLYLGSGGDEPDLIVMVVLHQTEANVNSFVGSFYGLDGPARRNYYSEDPSDLSQYSHGALFNPSGKGYNMPADLADSSDRQRSVSEWIKGKSPRSIFGPGGYNPNPSVGTAWYYELDPWEITKTAVGGVIGTVADTIEKFAHGAFECQCLTVDATVEFQAYYDGIYPVILLAPIMNYGPNPYGPVPTQFIDPSYPISAGSRWW